MSQEVEAIINWEPYNDEILSHFVEQNHTLEETRTHMRNKHGLNATARQFKRRFGGYKNLRAYEWIAVVEEVRSRAMRGFDSEVCLHGRPMDRERVKREVRRRGKEVQTEESRRVVISSSIRDRICIRAPRRRSTSPSLSSTANILQVDASTILGSIFPDLDFGGDVDMEDQFGDLVAFSAQEPPSWADVNPMSEDVSNDLIEEVVFNSSTSMVISPSAFQIDVNGFGIDGNFDSVMTINLPWFQLQQKLELQELGSRTNSPRMFSPRLGGFPNLSGCDFQSQRGSTTDLSVTERHHLLGSLLDYNTTGSLSDLSPTLTSVFSRVLPERFEGELSTRVQQFFDPSCKYPLQRCFELAAFLMSNNKPTKEKIQDFLQWAIDNKYSAQFEAFLRLDTSTTRAFSQTVLEAAASTKNISLLRFLLLSGADFKPIIREAIQITDTNFVELMLSRVEPEWLSKDSGGSLLLYVCETDNVRAASILVDNGANLNFNSYSSEKWGRVGTPLSRAVSESQRKLVRFLLDRGADVNAYCSISQTHTALAVYVSCCSDLEIATLLLEHGANVHCSVYGQDLLDYASLNDKDLYRLIKKKRGAKQTFVAVGDIVDVARKGSAPLSDYLSRHKDKVSQKQLEEALSEAVNNTDYGIKTAISLLDWGVDPDTPTLDEPLLLSAASCSEARAISATQILLDMGADINVPNLLGGVAGEGKFELLCELLDAGIDLDQFGPEALEKAVLCEHVEIVALLIDKGTPVNVIGARYSPLQAAASCKTLDLAEYLIDRGADVNTPAFGYEGRTALQQACFHGNLNMVKFLLANKADVNASPATSKGTTALEGVLSCRATTAVKEKLFQLLLDNGAKVTHSNERLCNGIIHTIVKKGLTNILEIALKAGANANSMSRGKEGRTPIQLAAELGQLDAVKTLMEHGAKINAAPAYQHGRTALQAAATLSSPNMELLSYLVDNGAEVNAPAGICGGITAMQGAAIAGNIPVVQYLWAKGALVNGKPAMKEGRTAVEGAAEHGRLDTVQLLLNYGATGSVGVEKGFEKAIKLAEENHHTEIVKMLRSAQLANGSELV